MAESKFLTKLAGVSFLTGKESEPNQSNDLPPAKSRGEYPCVLAGALVLYCKFQDGMRAIKWSLTRQALPAGYRNNSNGAFYNMGTNANYWSATESSGTNAWNRNLNSTESRSNRNNNNKTNGFSVRCLQD